MILGDYVLRKRKDPYEERAEDILKTAGYSLLPYEKVEPYNLCNAYGMKVNYSLIIDENEPSIAFASKKGRRGVINLGYCPNERVERETLAHEFSHLYLHQWNQISGSSVMIDKSEKQAFKLAASLLIPTKALLELEVFPDLNSMQ